MKRKNMILLLLCFCFLFPASVIHGAEIVGQAVYSDITAYINGLPIPSYNIDGYTAIVAEDLEQYGFRVYYYDEWRRLEIECSTMDDTEITADYQPEKNNKPGSFAANVYATDITTSVNGVDVPSYNIGGKTLIFMDSLASYGDVVWFPEERKICFTYVPSWEITIPDDYDSDTSESISDFTLELTKNADGSFNITGKNRPYLTFITFEWSKSSGLSFQFSLYMNVNNQTAELHRLLNSILNRDREGNDIKAETNTANEHMKIWINEEPVAIKFVQGFGGNGHSDFRFYLDKEIRSIEEIQSIQIECK